MVRGAYLLPKCTLVNCFFTLGGGPAVLNHFHGKLLCVFDAYYAINSAEGASSKDIANVISVVELILTADGSLCARPPQPVSLDGRQDRCQGAAALLREIRRLA